MTSAPQIAGYRFGEQLLDHALATVWRGQAVDGHEVVALVLTDAGAADATVRDRLAGASRDAAIRPAEGEAPLWAANLNTEHPYAITQLAPGLSGAERLLDPLDGVIGNDRSAIAEVRARLETAPLLPPPNGPAATSAPYADQQHGHQHQPNGETTRQGDGGTPTSVGWVWVLAVIVPLVAFAAMYSIGASVNSAMAEDEPTEPRQPVPAAVQPSPLPTKSVLLPGLPRAPQVGLRTVKTVYLVGTAFIPTQTGPLALGLPFAIHRPDAELQVVLREESAYAIYREISFGEPTAPIATVSIAARPCPSLEACHSERTSFEERWTSRFKAIRPVRAADDRTWIAEATTAGYTASMTRIYRSPATGGWWLIGVDATADEPGKKPVAQAVLNDIRTQTS